MNDEARPRAAKTLNGCIAWRLCYVEGDWAYFQDRDPVEVRGDDWNDAPYECNAGPPYGDSYVVGFSAGLDQPHDGHRNSPWRYAVALDCPS